MDQDRMWGVVSKYDKERGFGFIKSRVDGQSYFVQYPKFRTEFWNMGI